MQPIGMKYQNQIYDTQTLAELGIGLDKGEPIAFDNSPESLEIIRHSCAHLMAQAIKELYGDVQFFVGKAATVQQAQRGRDPALIGRKRKERSGK